MGSDHNKTIKYGALDDYKKEDIPETYEEIRYSSLKGKYLYGREQKAVGSLIERIPKDSVILDCPSGNGRWWPVLARRAKQIIAIDVSESMLNFSKKRIKDMSIDVELKIGNADSLPLDDESVDYVFCHALTKHLPRPVQYNALSEFGRVARKGVICSFGVFTHLNYEYWKRRNLVESFPLFYEELEWMAGYAGLKIVTMKKCTSPIGVERTVLFEKLKKGN